MNPGAVSSAKVMVARKPTAEGEEQGEDSLTKVVKKQEAALKRLEAKHGAGWVGTGVMAASQIPPQMAIFQTFFLKDLFFSCQDFFLETLHTAILC